MPKDAPPKDKIGREVWTLLWTRIREGDDEAIQKRKKALLDLGENLNWREAQDLWKRIEKGGDLYEDFDSRITSTTQEEFKKRLGAVMLVAAVVPQAYYRGIASNGGTTKNPNATTAKAVADKATGYKYDDLDPTVLKKKKDDAFREKGFDSPEYREASAAFNEWSSRLGGDEELKKFMDAAAQDLAAELGSKMSNVHAEGNVIKGTVSWTEHKEIYGPRSYGERWKLRDEYIRHSQEVTIAHFHDWGDLTFAQGQCNNGTAISEGLGPIEYVIDAVTLAGILKGLGKFAIKKLASRAASRAVLREAEGEAASIVSRRLAGDAAEEAEALARREAGAALRGEGDDAARAAAKPREDPVPPPREEPPPPPKDDAPPPKPREEAPPPKPPPPKPPKKAPKVEKKFYTSDKVPYSVKGPHGELSGTSVYVLKDASGNVLYVGKGTTFDRLRAHIKDVKKTDWFGEIEQIHVPATGLTNSEALALEQDLIAELKPLYNKDLNPFDKEFRGAMNYADNLPGAQRGWDFTLTWEGPPPK